MSRTRYIARAGVIAAVYGGLTLLVEYLPFQLGSGLVQFRVSEALTVLALFTPAAIPGLTIGSVIANALNPTAVWPLSLLDVVFGSLGTLVGAWWMWRHRERLWLALLGPVVANALIVPAYLPVLLKGLGLYSLPLLGIDLNSGHWLSLYLFGVAAIGFSEVIVVYGLGAPLSIALKRLGLAERLRD